MPLVLPPAVGPPSERGLELLPGQRRVGVEMLAGRHEGAQLPPPNTVELSVTQQPPRGSVGVRPPALRHSGFEENSPELKEGRLAVEWQAESWPSRGADTPKTSGVGEPSP